MASKILATYEAGITATITLGALANGAGRICTVIDNTVTRASMALIWLQVTMSDHAPTANTPIKLYLIRHSEMATHLVDNGLGEADAAVATEPTQAECLGSIIVPATADLVHVKSFVAYDLSPKYSFVVWNATGQHIDEVDAGHILQVVPVTPEAQ